MDLPELEPNAIVALDTETSGKHPDDGAAVSTVSLAWIEPGTSDLIQTLALPFNQGITPWKAEWRGVVSMFDEDNATNLDVQSWIDLWDWLQGKRLVMMNAPFDCRMMARGVDRPERAWSDNYDLMCQVIWDVGIPSRELWSTHSIALKPTCDREEILHPRHWVDVPYPVRTARGWFKGIESKDMADIKAYLRRRNLPTYRYDLIEWAAMEPYAGLDAELTLRLYIYQKRMLDMTHQRYMPWVEREFRKMWALHAVEMRGIPFDVDGCIHDAELIRQERLEIANNLPFRSPLKADINLNEAKEFFFGGENAPAAKFVQYTEKGAYKLDKELTRRLVRNKVPYAAEWFRYKELEDALSKWYEAFPRMAGRDGRLRPVFNISTVKSGRTSTSRINMQGVPKNYRVTGRLPAGVRTPRQLQHALPGHALWALDVAQAELRIAARWAPCPTMLQLIETGEDLHSYTAREVIGASRDDPDWDMYRHVGKTGNFALIYDCGPKTFQEMLSVQAGIEWPLDRVKDVVYRWKEFYPEFRAAVLRAMATVERQGYIRLKNGRESWFDGLDMFNPHKAFNRFVQGSLAEMAADWLIWTEENHPGLMVNFVHDAVYLHVPNQRAPEVELIRRKGIEIFENMFDIQGDIDAHVESEG